MMVAKILMVICLLCILSILYSIVNRVLQSHRKNKARKKLSNNNIVSSDDYYESIMRETMKD